MQTQVLVALDGTTNAEMILPHALFLAQQTPNLLTLLRVIVPPVEPGYTVPYIPDDWYGSEVSWTRQYLNSLSDRLHMHDIHVQTLYIENNVSASSAITSYAEQHPDVRLIALATHGRDAAGRLFLGSVAENVFASAPTSLLLLHPSKGAQLPPGPISRASYQAIVVPLDGTALSERAIEPATTLALRDHASLLLVSIPPPSIFEEIRVDEIEKPLQQVPARQEMKQAGFLVEKAEQLHTSTGLTVQTATADRDPEAFIEGLAQEHQQKLLIVTTREHAELKVMSFLHQCNVPVLFVTF